MAVSVSMADSETIRLLSLSLQPACPASSTSRFCYSLPSFVSIQHLLLRPKTSSRLLTDCSLATTGASRRNTHNLPSCRHWQPELSSVFTP